MELNGKNYIFMFVSVQQVELDAYDESLQLALTDDDYLARAIICTPDSSREKFRPGLADSTYLGFFSLEHATQTEESEIVSVKELTECIQQLLKEAGEMKRNIAFIRSSMLASFEEKLKQKSIDLYVRVNDKVVNLEKQHTERVDTIRRAFRQQLSDAISQITSYYNNDVNKQLTNNQKQSSSYVKRLKEMEALIKSNELMIDELRQKVAICESQHFNQPSSKGDIQMKSSNSDIGPYKEEIESLQSRLAVLEEEMLSKEESFKELQCNLDSSRIENDKLRREVETLKKSKEVLAAALENHQVESSRALENQRLALEKENEAILKKAKADLQQQSDAFKKAIAKQKEAQKPADLSKDPNFVEKHSYDRLLQEKKSLEEILAHERAENQPKLKRLKELELGLKKESVLQDQVNRLKKELENLEKSWQKKFSILQKSMFALKDESYLRHTLQKQSTALHQAAVSYAYDGPTGISGKLSSQTASNRKILPGIVRQKSLPQDYISYTVTPAYDGKTPELEFDDEQIMSDDEELPADVMPLPPPVVRQTVMT